MICCIKAHKHNCCWEPGYSVRKRQIQAEKWSLQRTLVHVVQYQLPGFNACIALHGSNQSGQMRASKVSSRVPFDACKRKCKIKLFWRVSRCLPGAGSSNAVGTLAGVDVAQASLMLCQATGCTGATALMQQVVGQRLSVACYASSCLDAGRATSLPQSLCAQV